MKIIVLGDTHGRQLWKYIVNKEQDADIFIFIGDYFDSHDDITTDQQINNFLDIIEFKKNGGKKAVLLIGNHDYHYFPEIGGHGISGYNYEAAPAIGYIIDINREHLQMAFNHENFLFTHAGVDDYFLENTFGKREWDIEAIVKELNDLFKYKPWSFKFNGTDCYGDDIGQTPIWIRPRSLMKGSQNLKKKGMIQVVGHTSQNQIDLGKATGGRYYFIDTLGTSGEYLSIEDGNVSAKK